MHRKRMACKQLPQYVIKIRKKDQFLRFRQDGTFELSVLEYCLEECAFGYSPTFVNADGSVCALNAETVSMLLAQTQITPPRTLTYRLSLEPKELVWQVLLGDGWEDYEESKQHQLQSAFVQGGVMICMHFEDGNKT